MFALSIYGDFGGQACALLPAASLVTFNRVERLFSHVACRHQIVIVGKPDLVS